MANRRFTPKYAPTNAKDINFNTSANPILNHQTTPRFKPKTQTSLMSMPERNEERMMTLKRNHDGETEIKFPIGNTKFIRETQKLFNKYFSGDNNDDSYTQPFEQKLETPIIDVPLTSKNSDGCKRLKSAPTPPVKEISKTELHSNNSKLREKSVARKDLLKENTQTQHIIDRKMIHLVGYVEHVIKWDQILKNASVCVIYNVLGTFVNTINGSWPMEKCIFIKGNNGTVLECSFFEIDRPCPVLTRGQFVGCVGQIIGIQKLKLYDIQILEESERNRTQRAIFLSQRMTHELIPHKSFS